jgi:hypothetical protein
MDRAKEPTQTTLAGAPAPAVKEIFSIIKKLEEEGITDGRHTLWAHFAKMPHVVIQRDGDGYVVLLWREGVYVEITLDEDLNVTGFDVEVRP